MNALIYGTNMMRVKKNVTYIHIYIIYKTLKTK